MTSDIAGRIDELRSELSQWQKKMESAIDQLALLGAKSGIDPETLAELAKTFRLRVADLQEAAGAFRYPEWYIREKMKNDPWRQHLG